MKRTIFLTDFQKNTQISDIMKTRLVRAELFCADRWTDRRLDGQTDRTKLIVAFRNLTNASKKNALIHAAVVCRHLCQ